MNHVDEIIRSFCGESVLLTYNGPNEDAPAEVPFPDAAAIVREADPGSLVAVHAPDSFEEAEILLGLEKLHGEVFAAAEADGGFGLWRVAWIVDGFGGPDVMLSWYVGTTAESEAAAMVAAM